MTLPASDALQPHFHTTRWSVVFAARDPAAPDCAAAMETLCRAYWYPIYAFIRRRGNSPHDAQDLAQEFFSRLLQKQWLGAVARERGRFRTFLIVAVKAFLANEWDKTQAARRGGGCAFVPLEPEAAEERYLADPAAALPADHLFERRWALSLLEQAMAELRAEYERDGRGRDFAHLKEYLTADRGAIPYATIAEAIGGSEGAARVAVHRLRKRFREVFRAAIADTVSPAAEVEDEMRHVVGILARL